MEKTEWCVTQDFGDYTVENTLFTYDESEREEQAINKTNASLILNPKFIPVYPSMIKDGYSYLDCIVYGFIDFFLCNNDKFYCTNEQLGEMLWTSEKTISLSVKKLKENWLIDISYRIKAGGGKVRFIKLVNSDFTKMYSGTLQKCKGIENKIIENKKINKSNWSPLPKPEKDKPLTLTSGDLTFENIYNLFYHKSWHKPSIDKCRKVFESLNLDADGYNMLVKDLKLFRIEYKYWIKDQMYRPWFEKYVWGFNAEWVNEEYRLKTIIKFHMDNTEDKEKMKKRYADLCETFGKDEVDALVKAYGRAKNKITLNIN